MLAIGLLAIAASGNSCRHRRRHWLAYAGRAEGNRCGLRRAHSEGAAACRAVAGGAEPSPHAGRQPDSRIASALSEGAGRLLAALHAASPRRCARHPGALPPGVRSGDELGGGQPAGLPRGKESGRAETHHWRRNRPRRGSFRAATSTASRWRSRSISWRLRSAPWRASQSGGWSVW